MMRAALPLSLARRAAVPWYPLAVASIVTLGVGLRLYGLTAHYLSYDETFTALAAQLPIGRLIEATAGDVHPPLSYMVSWLAVRLAGGVSPLALRLPSVLMGCAAMPLLLALARRLNISRAGVLAGLALFALSPFQVHYSQDARMYPLLQLAVLGGLVALYDRRWWLLAACLTAAAWTHNYGLIYLAVLAPLALARELAQPVYVEDHGELRPVANVRAAVLALAVPVVLWLPWAGVLASQMGTVAEGYWLMPLTLGQALYPLYTLMWGATMPDTLSGAAALVIYGAALFGLLKALRLRQQRALVWLVAGPFLAAGAVSVVWHPVYLFRGFVGAAGPLALLIGWAVTERTSWRLSAWAGAMILPLVMVSLSNRIPALHRATGENARALEVVRAGWQEGDIVYHGNVGSLSGFLVTAPDLTNYLMPVQPGSVGVLTPQTRQAMGFCEGWLSTEGLVMADCGAAGQRAQSWRRAWLVWGASQTISGVEDAAIGAILATFPNRQMLDIHDVYHGPMPVEGGIWLLTNP